MLGGIKHWLAQRMRTLGYTIIPNWQLANFSQAEYLVQLFGLLEVDCVLDVGANSGQYHDFLRHHVGYAGTVVSFEPVPTLGQHLQERAQGRRNWLIEPYALGTQRGRALLNVMVSDRFSSFLAPSHTGTDMFLNSNRVEQQVEVEVHTLDEVFPQLQEHIGFQRPYLKLDTQGFDLAVLEGAASSLPEIVALQTEASVTPIYEGAPDFATVIRHLENQGFLLSGIFANNPDHFPRMIEFDCHMINQVHVSVPTGPA
ncbi:MAG: FkbM family methyltransferase [Thermoguttaceae bacterium]|jgi:FkbM family methyltransferase